MCYYLQPELNMLRGDLNALPSYRKDDILLCNHLQRIKSSPSVCLYL